MKGKKTSWLWSAGICVP